MPANQKRIIQLRGFMKLVIMLGLLGLVWGFIRASSDDSGRQEDARFIVDTSSLKSGEWKVQDWQGRPVLVVHRNSSMLIGLEQADEGLYDPQSRLSAQPDEAKNWHRSVNKNWLVVFNQSPDTGCGLEVALSGISDSCRGSVYDWAGRVLADQPSKRNLQVVPHVIQ